MNFFFITKSIVLKNKPNGRASFVNRSATQMVWFSVCYNCIIDLTIFISIIGFYKTLSCFTSAYFAKTQSTQYAFLFDLQPCYLGCGQCVGGKWISRLLWQTYFIRKMLMLIIDTLVSFTQLNLTNTTTYLNNIKFTMIWLLLSMSTAK